MIAVDEIALDFELKSVLISAGFLFRTTGAKAAWLSLLSSDLTPSKETNQFARLFDHRHSTHAVALDQFIRRVHVG
jgi:hypothetical protein